MIFWRKNKGEQPEEQKQEPPEDIQIDQTEEVIESELSQPEIVEKSEELKEEGWFSRLSSGLKKSSQKFTDILTKRKLDEEALEDLEDSLIMADLGPQFASRFIQEFSATRFGKDVDDQEIKQALSNLIEATLITVAKPLKLDGVHKPQVVLFTGVNGVGKTTTIGKLASQYQAEGKSIMLAAADTFRAAAIDQLKIWGERNNCPVITKPEGTDPAAVAYEAISSAKEQNIDILFIDTAGRLHNKTNLMEELQKIVRVIQKQDESAPHASLLILDATTGQNAVSQVETFKDLINVSGLIVTKLDGSAKGGVIVALAEKFALPIHAVGVGETINDLKPFTAKEFSQSLIGIGE